MDARARFAPRVAIALSTILLAAVMLICIPQGQAQAVETDGAAATVQEFTDTLSTADAAANTAIANVPQQASGIKSKYGLLAKNGKVYPCTKKGKKLGKYWRVGSTIKTLFVAANAKKVPTKMKYSYKSIGKIPNAVKAKIKTIKFLTKKGKSKVRTIAKNSIPTTVSTVKNFQKTQVTTIAEGAFAKTKIKTLTLPKTLTTIGKRGFYGCTKLTSINASNTKLKSVGESGFESCTALKTLTLPKTLTTIGKYGFYGCTKLTSINASNTKLKSVGESGFESCTALATVSLPATCKSLGNYAFYGCTSLKTLKMLSTTVVPFNTGLLYNSQLYHGAAGAYIYVPNSALPLYGTANTWSDYYAYGIIKGV